MKSGDKESRTQPSSAVQVARKSFEYALEEKYRLFAFKSWREHYIIIYTTSDVLIRDHIDGRDFSIQDELKVNWNNIKNTYNKTES